RLDGKESIDEKTAEDFTTAALASLIIQGSIITSQNQSGGQLAHSITNIYHIPAEGDLEEEGRLSIDADASSLQAFGCPGVKLRIVSKGKRPAKIAKALLCLEDVGIMAAFQRGFGSTMGYTPLGEETPEVLVVELLPLQERTSPHGFVLERDDVADFYLPML